MSKVQVVLDGHSGTEFVPYFNIYRQGQVVQSVYNLVQSVYNLTIVLSLANFGGKKVPWQSIIFHFINFLGQIKSLA